MSIILKGRIDSNNAPAIEREIMTQLSGLKGPAVELDASELEYISSAGLRVLLRIRKSHPDMKITGVNSEVYEILDMTGFTEMMTVEKAYRVVSVEGCEVIGEGANGKVYRIDQDNVVKVYKNADALEDIQHEREVARLALVLGVPTAISYDVVRVGESYGSVFELLNARSFAKILAEEPERVDWCVREYVKLLKTVHSISVPAGKLPSIKEDALAGISRMKHTLSPEYGEKLLRMAKEIPESDHMIHGDYHTKNIVLADNEVLLIDMDTLSVGHPIFELAQMYNSYVGFSDYNEDIVLHFQGYPASVARAFWKNSLRAYLGTDDIRYISEVEDKVRCLAYADLIDWKRRHSDLTGEEDRATVELWTRNLTALLEHVDSLSFDLPAAGKVSGEQLVIEATADNLSHVLTFVNEQLERVNCPVKTQMQVNVAAEEIFINIANYAYAPGTGSVTVLLELTEDPASVRLTFMDSGVPFNPLEKTDPDVSLSAEAREIGGLGIFMTKKVMDDVRYEYRDGQNCLTLIKKI